MPGNMAEIVGTIAAAIVFICPFLVLAYSFNRNDKEDAREMAQTLARIESALGHNSDDTKDIKSRLNVISEDVRAVRELAIKADLQAQQAQRDASSAHRRLDELTKEREAV